MKMQFGKHKGKDISTLSYGYCSTLLENVPIKDPKLKKALQIQMSKKHNDLQREATYDSMVYDDDWSGMDYDGLDFGDFC